MREKRHPYEDILSVPRPTTHVRPPMSRQDRAAQFAPFAALTGHDAAIRETARTTQARRQLSEDEKLILDRKQQFLLEQVHQHPQVTVTYFQPDTRKAGERTKCLPDMCGPWTLSDGCSAPWRAETFLWTTSWIWKAPCFLNWNCKKHHRRFRRW